jgi:hypothetical protein
MSELEVSVGLIVVREMARVCSLVLKLRQFVGVTAKPQERGCMFQPRPPEV